MKEVQSLHTASIRTVQFYRDKFGKEITIEEARQINERVNVVFTLLAKWDREQRSEQSSSSHDSACRSVG